jgi:hypothetical protein
VQNQKLNPYWKGGVSIEEANKFLKSTVHLLPKGQILCIGEGEGRNALFLAIAGYIDLLLDIKEVKDELNDLDFKIAREIEREIIEGDFHTGLGSVVQIAGMKK